MINVNIILSLILATLIVVNLFMKSTNYFFMILFNFMNSIGGIYYAYGGNFYKPPNKNAIIIVLITFIIANISYITYVKIFKFKSYRIFELNTGTKKTNAYFPLFILPPLIYFIIFRNGFSLVQNVMGNLVPESSRADVSGSIPKFYTFSVFVTSLAIPFCIDTFKKTQGRIKLTYCLLLIFFSILLGDKITILTIIFYLYMYNSKTNKIKINLKEAIVFGIIFIFVYIGSKYLHYGSIPNFKASAESIFRRVIVINTSLYGNFIDYFIIQAKQLPPEFTHIKQFMFFYIYGYLPGGAPVNFLGSILSWIGFGFIQSIIMFIAIIGILRFRDILIKIKMCKFKEAVLFLNFYGAILLVNSYISDYMIRVFLPIVFFIIIDKISFKNVF